MHRPRVEMKGLGELVVAALLVATAACKDPKQKVCEEARERSKELGLYQTERAAREAPADMADVARAKGKEIVADYDEVFMPACLAADDGTLKCQERLNQVYAEVKAKAKSECGENPDFECKIRIYGGNFRDRLDDPCRKIMDTFEDVVFAKIYAAKKGR